MVLRFFCTLAVCMLPTLASAQAPRVVVIAPQSLRDALCDALTIELGTRGAAVSPSQRPSDGDFVVAVEAGDEGLGMVITANRTGREIHAPRLDATDGRSLAVVAASLLDEVLEPPPPPPPARSSGPPARLARELTVPEATAPPPEPAAAPFFDDEAPDEEPAPPPAEHAVLFGASLGGAFLSGDGGFYSDGGGPLVRLRLGWRFQNLLRIAASLEGSLISQDNDGVNGELQPMFMPGLEASLTADVNPVSLHFGARVAITVREYSRAVDDGFGFRFNNSLAGGFALGGFVGASVYATRALSLWLRLDLLAAETDFGDSTTFELRQGTSFLGTLSVGVVIE